MMRIDYDKAFTRSPTTFITAHALFTSHAHMFACIEHDVCSRVTRFARTQLRVRRRPLIFMKGVAWPTRMPAALPCALQSRGTRATQELWPSGARVRGHAHVSRRDAPLAPMPRRHRDARRSARRGMRHPHRRVTAAHVVGSCVLPTRSRTAPTQPTPRTASRDTRASHTQTHCRTHDAHHRGSGRCILRSLPLKFVRHGTSDAHRASEWRHSLPMLKGSALSAFLDDGRSMQPGTASRIGCETRGIPRGTACRVSKRSTCVDRYSRSSSVSLCSK
jgi:hypothetical protein